MHILASQFDGPNHRFVIENMITSGLSSLGLHTIIIGSENELNLKSHTVFEAMQHTERHIVTTPETG